MIRAVLNIFVWLTRPLVWRLANAYGLRINRHIQPQGQHPVVVRGGRKQADQYIPKSLYCNTRSGQIEIGEETMFGEDVMLLSGKHMSLPEAEAAGVPLHTVPGKGRDIIIGRNCYIGSRAILIGPITVGDYAVIGAGSVVTKDIPTRTFAAGVPAVIKGTF